MVSPFSDFGSVALAQSEPCTQHLSRLTRATAHGNRLPAIPYILPPGDPSPISNQHLASNRENHPKEGMK